MSIYSHYGSQVIKYLSAYLADILSCVVGKTEYHVKNSRHLVETLAEITLDDDEILNSHDVVSLFTNTPINKSLEVIKESLLTDNAWKDKTKLLVEDVMELLEFILTTTYFVFRDQIYSQKFGTAMGSPVSPMVADMFMEFLEQSAIASVPVESKPKLWKRYVDDILEVIKKHGVDGLTQHLNSVDDTGSIKFTAEQEKDQQMPFLDTLIVRKPDGHVKLLVYRKSTHTDQYLHFSSHHPLQHKLSVIRTLLDRSTNIVTEEQDRKQEEHHIQTALTCCGYPEWSINKAKSQMATSKQTKVTRKLTRKHSDVNKTTVVIPYVQDLSEAVTRVYNRYGIPTAMRPFKS